MKVIYISSEISPVAKVGGLADVVLGLSRAIQSAGHETHVILPKYKCLKEKYFDDFKSLSKDVEVTYGKKKYSLEIYQASLHGLPVLLFDAHGSKKFFDTDTIYGTSNDIQRFTFFSVAALELTLRLHPDVDILHINEWHTSIGAPLYHHKYRGKFHAKLMLTIHNMDYQGLTSPAILDTVGLPRQPYEEQMRDERKPDKLNLLKAGMIFSNAINTVSPSYAKEIQSPPHGCGLENLIEKHKDKFFGILNGIDYEIWNPSSDPALDVHFSQEDFRPKSKVKKLLQERLGMNVSPSTPIVTCICRLVPQKGIALIKHAIEHTLGQNKQFILFGSSPNTQIQNEFNELAKSHSSNKNAKFIFDSYQEELSHHIYAGSDMIICPSLFEPCGLTQLIALRYGTVPIVRQTGGLADTVFDIDSHNLKSQTGNGFTFLPATKEAIEKALDRAFKIYSENPKLWSQIISTGMKMNYSWKHSAAQYLQIYEQLKKESQLTHP